VSTDAGATFNALGAGMEGYWVWAIAFDPDNPTVMYAGTGTPTPAAIFRSDDAGEYWRELPMEVTDECEAVGVPRITAIAIDPANRNSIWVGIEVDGVRHSTDGGETWTRVEGIPNPDVHSVAVSREPSKKVFVLVNNEIYTTQDEGANWKPLGIMDKFPFSYPRGFRLHPEDPDTAYVTLGDSTPGTTGTVMRTTDGGESWDALPIPDHPNSAMWVVDVQPYDTSVMFAASRYGYLYRSDDSGNSWRKLWRELSEISSIQWVPA
jgi:photosystem II stability/assembly factor-like uncharacterized protein